MTSHEQAFVIVAGNVLYVLAWIDHLRFRKYKMPKARKTK